MPPKTTRGRPRKNTNTFTCKKSCENFDVPEQQEKPPELLKVFLKVVASMNKEIGWGLNRPEDYPLIKKLEREIKDNTCDNALIEFCQMETKTANEDYLEKICRVIIGYRECLNLYGWQRLGNDTEEEYKFEAYSTESPKVLVLMNHNDERQKKMREEYSAVNSPDRLPEIANEFVILFARENDLKMTQQELIEIVTKMCDWLYTNNYTRTQLATIK